MEKTTGTLISLALLSGCRHRFCHGKADGGAGRLLIIHTPEIIHRVLMGVVLI
jgi:hypothetical protein